MRGAYERFYKGALKTIADWCRACLGVGFLVGEDRFGYYFLPLLGAFLLTGLFKDNSCVCIKVVP